MAEAIENQPGSDNKPKRPLILTIVALLLFARVILIGAITAVAFYGMISTKTPGTIIGVQDVALELFMVALTLVLFVAALGLWLLRPWAWQMNMIILGFYLIIDLWNHNSETAGLGNDATLLLNILIVFYLVQKDVRTLFNSEPIGVS